MHLLKRGVPLLLAALLTGGVSASAAVADIPYDRDGSCSISVFDAALLKREKLSVEQIADENYDTLSGYLVRRNGMTAMGTYLLEEKGTLHSGEGTYYGGGYEGGCCMLEPVPEELFVCAMNITDYNNAMLAGAYIEATGPEGTVQMYVTDLLPEGKPGDVDFNINAFPEVAPLWMGRVNISWKIISFPTDEPVSYRYQEGSTKFWCGIQVRNHRYPVAKLEVLCEDGTYQELPRKQYNYFDGTGIGGGPFTFRVTSIFGDVFIDENIPLSPDEDVVGTGQFPV